MAHRIRKGRAAGLFAGVTVAAAALTYQLHASSSSTDAATATGRAQDGAFPTSVWPPEGQAAFVLSGHPQVHVGPNQHAAPIASVAKVMTAYVVLRDHPLRPGESGPTITLTDADVADTDRRRRQDESVVPVADGEQVTELQALQALLLPSANNVAAALARWDAARRAGSSPR